MRKGAWAKMDNGAISNKNNNQKGFFIL